MAATLTATATCRAYEGADTTTGEALPTATVAERVGWAASLAAAHARSVVAAGYTPGRLAALTEGVGPDGRRLPSRGYVAARRLAWAPTEGDGVYLPDRLRRVGEEQAMRRLRQAAWADEMVRALTSTWPQRPKKRTPGEWEALWGAAPAGADKASVRNRTRQIARYQQQHGRLPDGVCDLEPEARVGGRMLLLAAADRQLVTVERLSRQQAMLHVKLPTVEQPQHRRDWGWVALPIGLPAHVPDHAQLHTPTLRLDRDGRVRVDLPWTELAPDVSPSGHVRAVGFDWGVNTLATAALADQTTGSDVFVDGRPAQFDAAGARAKAHRLRRLREQLRGKVDRARQLAGGLPRGDARRAHLEEKTQQWEREIAAVSRRQTRLNHEMAWAAARWLVDLAVANAATVIYAEDLRSMEVRGLGQRVNARASNTVRGKVLAATRHLAARAGVAVVEVPAAGTSQQCPRCLTKLAHHPAPDRSDERGHAWASCRACGFSGDRDHAAAERIASRGLAGQHHTRRRRNGTYHTTTPADRRCRRARRPRDGKIAPTTQRPRKPARSPRLADLPRQAPTSSSPTLLSPASGGTTPNEPFPDGSEARNEDLSAATVRRWYAGYGFRRGITVTPARPRQARRRPPDHPKPEPAPPNRV